MPHRNSGLDRFDDLPALFPFADDVIGTLEVFRVAQAVALFVTFYALFYVLTPTRYRKHGCRKWPGALLITVWWLATVELLPQVLAWVGGYSITYDASGNVIREAQAVRVGERITTQVARGRIDSEVKKR